MDQYVVMFSGGVGSWAAARRLVDQRGVDGVTLLFTDTLIEDSDLYRFLDEAAANLGAPLVRIADGRTPWQVFRDRRMLGNSRIAPCSVELKQKPARRWMAKYAPDATVVLGIDWTEIHRLAPAQRGWKPWRVVAPLTERPYRAKAEFLADLDRAGIARPMLYREGFPHNNCGGGCVRAGAAQFRRLLQVRPKTFAEWEHGEQEMRQYLNADVTILRETHNKEKHNLTLTELRKRLQSRPTLYDDDEWGGCGCFLDDEVTGITDG